MEHSNRLHHHNKASFYLLCCPGGSVARVKLSHMPSANRNDILAVVPPAVGRS